eukprot:389098-Alexandrium_andersonii.AAC.1
MRPGRCEREGGCRWPAQGQWMWGARRPVVCLRLCPDARSLAWSLDGWAGPGGIGLHIWKYGDLGRKRPRRMNWMIARFPDPVCR